MRRAVIDQPGLKVIVLGLLISVFVGLAIRSQITQSKIQDRLLKIVHEFEQKKENRNISIDFSEARLMLSDWGFPFPHLSLKDIKISFLSHDCIDNQIYIESLDLPFSWFNLLKGYGSEIDTVRAGVIELRLDHPDQCLADFKATRVTTNQTEIHKSLKIPETNNNPSINEVKLTQHLNLYIEKLKIVDKHNYNIPVLLQTVILKFDLDGSQIDAADLKSQLYLFRDSENSLYKFKSDFNFNYKKNSEGLITSAAQIRGKLIDKAFEIDLTYDPKLNKILIAHTMNELSVKALMSLTNNQNIRAQSQWDSVSGLSISSRGEGEYDMTQKTLNFYKIFDIILASNQSSVSIKEIHINSLKPILFEPFVISLNEFDLEKLKSIPAFNSIQKSINNFGTISGAIAVNSESDISGEGSVKGLELIFSNRGQRAYQKIDELLFTMTPRDFLIHGITLQGVPTQGTLKVHYEDDAAHQFSRIQAQADISQIKLDDTVFSIFSFTQVKPTTISLALHFQENQLNAKINFDQLASNAIEIRQLDVGFGAHLDPIDGRLHHSVLDLAIKNIKFVRHEDVDESFYTVLEQFEHNANYDETSQLREFYLDQIKGTYLKNDDHQVNLKVTGNYFSKLRNEKNNFSIHSQFSNQTQAQFDLDLFNHGRSIQKFSVDADLSRYLFNVKK